MKPNQQATVVLVPIALVAVVLFVFVAVTIVAVTDRQRAPVDLVREEMDNIQPIDVVYTWVDSSDSAWLAQKNKYSTQTITTKIDNNDVRFSPKGATDCELHMSLRSVLRFLPWVRKIWIVTQRPQRPPCLDEIRDSRIKVVHHDQIFNEKNALPVFNSHAIEAHVHNITGLAEQFLYLNDDCFFANYGLPHFWFVKDRPVIRTQFAFLPPSLALHFGEVHTAAWINLSNIMDMENNEKLLKVFGCVKPLHVGVPLTKTMMRNASESNALKNAWARTAISRFRCETDIPPIGATVQYALRTCVAWSSIPNDPHTSEFFERDCSWHAMCASEIDRVIQTMPTQACINSSATRNQADVVKSVTDTMLTELKKTILISPTEQCTWLIVAHPDDEVIFGWVPLLQIRPLRVLCLTNSKNAQRSIEFFSVMSVLGLEGTMLDCPDSTHDVWDLDHVTDVVAAIIKQKGAIRIISHSANGEYGHTQHVQTHTIAKRVAEMSNLSFATFCDCGLAAHDQSITERKRLLTLYQSQKESIRRYGALGRNVK